MWTIAKVTVAYSFRAKYLMSTTHTAYRTIKSSATIIMGHLKTILCVGVRFSVKVEYSIYKAEIIYLLVRSNSFYYFAVSILVGSADDI